MEAVRLYLTEDRVEPLVTTKVADAYLASVPSQSARSAPSDELDVERLRDEVSGPCFQAASGVARLLQQLDDAADRVVLSRTGAVAFIFLGGAKYAMLEADGEGSIVALLSDRARDDEAETWEVEPDGLTATVRRIRDFVGSPA